MLNQVQHDGVVTVSLRTPPIRHPELVSGSRHHFCVTLNLFQGLVFHPPHVLLRTRILVDEAVSLFECEGYLVLRVESEKPQDSFRPALPAMNKGVSPPSWFRVSDSLSHQVHPGKKCFGSL